MYYCITQHHGSVVVRRPPALAARQTGLVVEQIAELHGVLREDLHVTDGAAPLVLLSLQLLQLLPGLLLPPLDVLRSDDTAVLCRVVVLQCFLS